MDKNKQIEEMAKIICGSHNNGVCVFNHEPCDLDCSANGEAKKLYDSGYRKASEVAKEIFEKIKKILLDNHIKSFKNLNDEWVHHFKENLVKMLAELEKELTEEEK